MVQEQQTLLVLGLILFFGLVIPEVLKKVRFSFFTSLILIGAFLGPFGINYLELNDVINFMGFLGSAFIMLLTGLEVKSSYLSNIKKVYPMSALNGIIPFCVGALITLYFGYPVLTSILVGLIFFPSSITIIIAALKEENLENRNIGKAIISSSVFQEIITLLLIAVLFEQLDPSTRYPIFIYFGLLVSLVILLKLFIPELITYFFKKSSEEHEDQLRFVIVLLMFVLLIFSGLGVHPIVAAFLVGVVISDALQNDAIYKKLHSLSYGFFIPVFFFIIGMELDFSILSQLSLENVLVLSLLIGFILSKTLSAYFSAKLSNFNSRSSMLYAIISNSKLTTLLATVYVAFSLGIIDNKLLTGLVLISVVTTILSPIILSLFVKGVKHA